jgi:hypothetical protein
VLSPILPLAAGYGAIVLLAVILDLAVLVFGVDMLRASVVPVAPPTLVIAVPIAVFVTGLLILAVSFAGGDSGQWPVAVYLAPIALTAVGLGWLGWHLSQETAVDAGRSRRRLAAG